MLLRMAMLLSYGATTAEWHRLSETRTTAARRMIATISPDERRGGGRAPPTTAILPSVAQQQQTVVEVATQAELIAAIGSNLPATLIPYYVDYVIGDPNVEQYLLLYFLTGVVLLPFWVRLAKRVGKKPAWLAAAALNSLTFAGVFFLGPGDSESYAILVIASGLGFGATLALPSAMQADVIDYEELRSGERKEGEIIGLWAVSKKLAAAFGVFLAFPILGAVGYVPNAAQPEAVVLTLKILYALVPSLFNLLGLWVAWHYPIDKAAHEKILEAVRARRAGERFADPLEAP